MLLVKFVGLSTPIYRKMSVDELVQTCTALTNALNAMSTFHERQQIEIATLRENNAVAGKRIRDLETEKAYRNRPTSSLEQEYGGRPRVGGSLTTNQSFVLSEYGPSSKKPDTDARPPIATTTTASEKQCTTQ